MISINEPLERARLAGMSMLAVCLLLLAVTPHLLASQGTEAEAEADRQAGPGSVPQKTARPQTTCPVMGGPIDKAIYVDTGGKRIYLCCAACEAAVRTEPDRYLDKIEKRGEGVENSPTP